MVIFIKDSIWQIVSNSALTKAVYQMRLRGDVSAITAPGQFLNIRLAGLTLRRPISICDRDDTTATILYKVVGKGTEQLSHMKPGETLQVMAGLGNGFDLSPAGARPLLIGGGVGVPPLYLLARKLIETGRQVTVILGFNTAEECFYEEEFRAIGCRTILTTADGSAGRRGFVTDALPEDYTYFYTCGPEAMLKAVFQKTVTSGQFSFEERMGCGFGACMGCSCKTVTGYKRICKDGPVLLKEEILWGD